MIPHAPCRLEHIDIEQPIPPLSADSGEGGVYVVFWYHDVPVGITTFLSAELPILPEALMAMIPSLVVEGIGSGVFPQLLPGTLPLHPSLAQPARLGRLDDLLKEDQLLKRFEATIPRSTSGEALPTLSVVICTKNRPASLRRCLDSLVPLIADIHEIIVVDNAPGFPDAAAIAKGREKVHYVEEPRSGLSVARNTGVRYASGSIIAFTDDDTVVHPCWAKRIARSFDSPDVLCVTGLVLPLELRTTSQVAFELELGGFGRCLQRRHFLDPIFRPMLPFGAPVWHIGAGANMAIHRSAFEKVGSFDERLGAGASGCSEDSEFWYRLLAAGCECQYDPSIVVYHEHRATEPDLKHQLYEYSRGHVSALLVQYARHRHLGNLRRLFVTIPRYYLSQSLAALRSGQSERWRWLLPQWAGFVAGLGSLWWFRRSSKQLPPLQ